MKRQVHAKVTDPQAMPSLDIREG